MTLTDALSHLRSISDQTHKFWGYYQAVTAASVVFAWTDLTRSHPALIPGLVFAYAMFAILNCRLVVSSQVSALATWQAIQNYTPLPNETVNPGLLPLTKLNKPDNPKLVGGMHVLASIMAGYAMYARTL
jgi:hypothetical protein